MTERRLIAQGREAEVLLQADGTIVKLWREPSYIRRLEREVAALNALAEASVAAPRVLGTVTIDGRPGLVSSRIDGEDLLAALAHRPLHVLRAGRALGLAHIAMHDIIAPRGLPDLKDDLRDRIRRAEPLPEDLHSAVLGVLDRLPAGDRLCHGDFHLGNIMGTWSVPAVIDWGDAARGDPVADVARTDLLLRMGEPSPGAPTVVRVLAPVGRDLLAGRYLSTYRRHRPVDRRRLGEWSVVRAAARLSEPIPGEHPKLIRLIRRHLARMNS